MLQCLPWIYVLLQVALSIHVLMTKHNEPQSAMLWLLLILVLPGAGSIFYLCFGFNLSKSRTKAMAESMEELNRERYEFFQHKYSNFSDKLEAYLFKAEEGEGVSDFNATLDKVLPEAAFRIGGNRVELLRDGNAAYAAMIQAIKRAESSIHLQSFIISNDLIGKTIFDELAEKARQGVEVRVLYDGFGSIKSYFGHFFRRYTRKRIKNFQIHAFSPINIFTPWRIQLRNHRKLLIVDGRVAFTGGVNISDENLGDFLRYPKRPKISKIHDLHCWITGPAVPEFQIAFFRDWAFAVGKHLPEMLSKEYFPDPVPTGKAVLRVVSSGPGQNFGASMNVFYTATVTAKKTIWIMSPYFVPDQSFVKALTMAAARGVDVKVIVPAINNHFYVDWAARSLYRTFLAHGVKIYERKDTFSHIKAMIVDNEWVLMGSSNCDVRSFRLNYELDFCAEHSVFVDDMRRQFQDELDNSRELKLDEVRNTSFARQFGENLCALLTPIL